MLKMDGIRFTLLKVTYEPHSFHPRCPVDSFSLVVIIPYSCKALLIQNSDFKLAFTIFMTKEWIPPSNQ